MASAPTKKQELQAIAEKIGEIESDADEHRLVIKTLSEVHKQEPERTCFRLISGVLVERTVKDVLPTLETTYNGLVKVLADLANQYRQKELNMQKIQQELKE